MMSHAPGRRTQLRRNLVVVPALWTHEQLEFLRFSFPSHALPMSAAPAPSGDSARPPWVESDLSHRRFARRHSAISGLFKVPMYGYGANRMLPLRFRRRRRFAEVECVVFSPRDTDPRKPYIAAYVDEGGIYWFQQKATDKPVKPRVNQPYISAILIALAQATYKGEDVDHVKETSVLFSENPKPRLSSGDPVREFLLYTADIPLVLLKFFQNPKATLPAYDPIIVSCVSIPVEPLETLRESIVMAIPNSPDPNEEEDVDKEQISPTSSSPLADS